MGQAPRAIVCALLQESVVTEHSLVALATLTLRWVACRLPPAMSSSVKPLNLVCWAQALASGRQLA
jgi:hypothetical protein